MIRRDKRAEQNQSLMNVEQENGVVYHEMMHKSSDYSFYFEVSAFRFVKFGGFCFCQKRVVCPLKM